MRVLTVIFCCAFVAASASAQQIYRWIDDDGVVHYSDQPRNDGRNDDAQQVDIQVPPGISNPTRVISVGGVLDDAEQQEADNAQQDAYRQVVVADPAEQQVVWNIATRLPVQITIEPALAGSHRIQMLLDNQPIGEPFSGTSTTVSPVYRGEHTLTPTVIDADGNTIHTGQPTTFYVQQASVARP